MSKSGWFTVSRDIKDHWVWDCEFSNGQAWIDLIMHASHSSDRKKVIKGQMIQWGRGEQIRSIVTLSETWGWSRKRVTKFLKMLEDDGMISLKKGHLTTVISVCNYDTFQSKGTAKVTPDGTPEEHQGSISGTAKVTQITMSTMEDNSNNGKQLSNLPAKAGSTASDIQEAFNCWVQVMEKNTSTKLNKKREAAVRARLKEGYTIDQIKQAIVGCSKTPHNMGINDQRKRWDDLELICRNGNNVERFMDNDHNPPAAPDQQFSKVTAGNIAMLEQFNPEDF